MGEFNSKSRFDIPVALFIFRRKDTVLKIIDVLRCVNVSTILLIGDGGRTDLEAEEVSNARRAIEQAIDWPCNVLTNYAERNRGVYNNIAGGAKWAFSQFEEVIFLEDDNLPERSFFAYCESLLDKYREDENVFWICGTNYLEDCSDWITDSYVFTQHLMPCGWASWGNKFNKYYDDDFEVLLDKQKLRAFKDSYANKALFRQQRLSARSELYRKGVSGRYASWDFQLPGTIRGNHLVGIAPCKNQIQNIGVDSYSIHGGTSMDNTMTERFCGIKSHPLSLPLTHPEEIVINSVYEDLVGKIILMPLSFRIKAAVAKVIKTLFGISEFDHFSLENSRWKNRL